MRTLANANEVDVWHLRWEKVQVRGRQAVELARRLDDPRVEVAVSYETARALAALGEREEAHRISEAMLPLAERLRDFASYRRALWMNGTLCRAEGNWQDARAFLERYLAAGGLGTQALSDLAVLDHQVGDIVQGHGHVDRLVANLPTGAA